MSFGCYTCIDTQKQEIRLVTIKPAEDDSLPIKCTLSMACLKNPPEFTAFSYVWGDVSISYPILLDGEELYITKNLFDALKTLRSNSVDLVCWIDAICINQQDTMEKNSQVLLMGDIYAAAHFLIIWLGEESDDSDLACALLVEWGEAHRNFVNRHERAPETVEDFRIILDEVETELSDPFDEASWDALSKFFDRPWWQRIWVLQEFAKARLRVFMCGSFVFDANTLLHAWAVWDSLKETPLVLATVAFRAAPILIEYSSAKFTALLDLWEFDRPLPLLDFLKILYQTRFFRSTDPRDKLYGILGLASSTEIEIKPHYEWSRQMVYVDLFRTLLNTTKKLQVLSLSGISTAEKGHTCTLPSWTPHLDCEMSAVGVPFYNYKASGVSIAEAHIAPNSLSLFAKGLVHSSVTIMHLFPSESYPKDLDVRISFLPNASNYNPVVRAIEDIEVCLRVSRKSISRRYPTGDTVLLALFSLLTGKDPAERSSFHLICGYLGALNAFVRRARGRSFDHKLFNCGVTELLHQDVNNAFWGSREPPDGFTDDLAIDANVVPFLEEVKQAMSNSQCFFITRNKYIGIGPRAMRPDDRIFIPFGCDVPLVVRSTGKEFIIIGSCIIHGLMEGEIMKGLDQGNIAPEVLEFI